MDYNGGFLFNNFDYALTTTYVYSPGGGVDLDLTENLALKADAQFEHWGQTPTASGSVYSTVATVGVVYRLDFNHRRRR